MALVSTRSRASDLFHRRHRQKPRIASGTPSRFENPVHGRDPLDLLVGELLLLPRAGNQRAELAAVDEQDLALPLAESRPAAAALRQEPEQRTGSACWRTTGR